MLHLFPHSPHLIAKRGISLIREGSTALKSTASYLFYVYSEIYLESWALAQACQHDKKKVVKYSSVADHVLGTL